MPPIATLLRTRATWLDCERVANRATVRKPTILTDRAVRIGVAAHQAFARVDVALTLPNAAVAAARSGGLQAQLAERGRIAPRRAHPCDALATRWTEQLSGPQIARLLTQAAVAAQVLADAA